VEDRDKLQNQQRNSASEEYLKKFQDARWPKNAVLPIVLSNVFLVVLGCACGVLLKVSLLILLAVGGPFPHFPSMCA
jgi:hypothetical protein